MNKNQWVFVIGGTFIGAIGMVSTWYAGRKSYQMGFSAGMQIADELHELKDMTKAIMEKHKDEES